MSIILAFSLFSVVILVYLVLIEVFTVMFRLTGMTDEIARFQVMSLLTGTGYTTHESEMVTDTKKRRVLARAVMIFGYVFTVTIVSSLVNIFLAFKLNDLENILLKLPWPLIALLFVLMLFRIKAVKEAFDRLVNRIANRVMTRGGENVVLLLDEYGGKAVCEVHLDSVPLRYQSIPLAKTDLRQEFGVMVLLKRGEKGEANTADADTVLLAGDVLVVFGPLEQIREAFNEIS